MDNVEDLDLFTLQGMTMRPRARKSASKARGDIIEERGYNYE